MPQKSAKCKVLASLHGRSGQSAKLKCLTRGISVLVFLTFSLSPFPFPLSPINAQGIEVTSIYPIADPDAKDGDILTNAENGLVRSSVSFDSRIFGVLQQTPIITFHKGEEAGKPVARTGVATVNATTLAGAIKPGDYITSSEIAGHGAKAQRSGYTLGVALSSLEEGKGEQIDYIHPKDPKKNKKVTAGKIQVALKIELADVPLQKGKSFLQNLALSIFGSGGSPQSSGPIRYVAAASVILAAGAAGFFAFARAIPKAVEAIGRNPLAKSSIILGIALNVGLLVLALALGVAAAVVILLI